MYLKSLIIFLGIISEIAYAQNSDICGKPQVGIGNIVEGSRVQTRGAFPWVTVITNNEGELHCGGTLVSSRKVISTAHCFHDKFSPPEKPEDFKVILGLYDFDDKFESGRKTVGIDKIIIHKDWNNYGISYDADISVLVLAEYIQFNTYIQPICLINNSPVAAIRQGVVIGYGRSVPGSVELEKRPKMIKIVMHRNSECFLRFTELARISSAKTFCGGSADGGGVCNRDSGNGFFVLHKGIYYLRGIVSASSVDELSFECDIDTFAVYTNLLHYVDWIKKVEPTNDIVEPPKEPQNNFFKAPSLASTSLIDTEDCGKFLAGVGNIYSPYIHSYNLPWIAALLKSRTKFFCGGTLVSDQKVVTAAHCIQNKNIDRPLLARDITVLLGMHGLNDYNSIGRKLVPVYRIFIHDDWNPYSKRFDSDIAVLVLDEKIKFDRYIQPICLISPKSQVAFKTEGYAVGYRNSKAETENVPKWVHTKIQNDRECSVQYAGFRNISSDTSICGGILCEIGVCNGDSGSGIFAIDSDTFYLRAIVSVITTNLDDADKYAYSLFTDVLQFNEWIIKIKP